ncbi:hypothetical protein QYE76_026729 [Lolium multiflorum]|uniref:CCHC-type domain-containing protein n=1 Tax=Lolium multiflorum TaxID=4521 RepID=A0AAD8VVH2_LOLMU|nr:hypothetical protein QYE76_026729 [Lolium multiflorum]
MASRVILSDSDRSDDSVSSRAPPPPPLRSLVVAPASHQLGSRGWDAGAGSSRPRTSPVAARSEAAEDGGRPWRLQESRRARVSRRAQARPASDRRILPASRPPGANASRIPSALHGRCYNCGEDGHISAQCHNDTLCVRCGGSAHTSKDCKRPRSPPEASPPLQAPPPLRPVVAAAGGSARRAPALPGAAPVRSWRDVVSSGEDGAAGDASSASDAVGFSAPFAPPSPSSSATAGAPRVVATDRPDVCYVQPSLSMVQLEADLDRAVMVSVVGARIQMTPEIAAAEIRAYLNLPASAFSIRPFEPADFLLLCASVEVRDAIVHQQSVGTPQFTLHLEPWTRQVGAALREAPFLAELEITGIPGHAWAESTASKLLEGAGVIDEVDPATASRSDMSCFRLSVWMHDIAAIPALRWLAVPEPGSGLRLQVATGRRRPRSESPRMLWYRVRFWVARWLVGGPPSSGSDGGDLRGGATGASGSGGGGAPPGEPARRRRRRRAPRRRRGRRASGPEDAVLTVASPLEELGRRQAVEPASLGRWRPESSPAATVTGGGTRADVSAAAARSDRVGPGCTREGTPHGPQHESRDLHSACSSTREIPQQTVLAPAARADPCLEASPTTCCSNSCSASAVGSPGCLQGDRDTLVAAAAFLSGRRASPEVDAASPAFLSGRSRGSSVDRAATSHWSPPQSPMSGPQAAVSGANGHACGPAPHALPNGHASGPTSPATLTRAVASHGVAPANSASPPLDGHAAGHAEPAAAAAGEADVHTLTELLRQFKQRLEDPLLALPDPKLVRRRLFPLVHQSTRRSSRLAAKGKGTSMSTIKRAQRVLMQKLGVCGEEEKLTPTQLKEYAEIFASPLGPEQLAAIAALFGLGSMDGASIDDAVVAASAC